MRLSAATIGLAASLVLLLPGTAAAQLGTLSATRVDLHQGAVLGAGGSLVFEPGIPLDDVGLDLVAERVEGVIHATRSDVVAAGATVTPRSSDAEPVRMEAVQGASLRGDEDLRFIVLPWEDTHPTLHGSSVIGAIHAENADRPFDPKATETLPTILVPSAGGLALELAEGRLELKGSFRIVLWSGTLTLGGARGEQEEVVTGLRTRVLVPSPMTPRGVEQSEEREAYLNVSQGRLTIPAQAGLLAFSRSLDLMPGEGSMLIRGARGTPIATVPLNDSKVVATGDVVFVAVNEEGRLAGFLEGSPRRLVIDGLAVDLPSSDAGWPLWTMALGWLALLVVGYVAYHALAAGGLRRLETLMARGAYGRAERWAARLQRLPKVAEDALVAQAVSLVRLQRPAEARALLERPPWPERPCPARLFLRARIAAEAGDDAEAQRLLADCVALSPRFMWDAQADPFLGPLVRGVQTGGGAYA